jgi:hypothetical protein
LILKKALNRVAELSKTQQNSAELNGAFIKNPVLNLINRKAAEDVNISTWPFLFNNISFLQLGENLFSL